MSGRKFAGGALILLGVVFLAVRIIDFDFSLWKWWPVLPIASGVLTLKGNWKVGLVIIAFFSVFLLNNLNVLDIDTAVLWPTLLVVIGLAIFFGRGSGGKAKTKTKAAYGSGGTRTVDGSARPSAEAVDAGERLNVNSSFSESSHSAAGEGFTGGNVSATFGTADIDLRSAVIVDGEATLNASVMFGSVNLRVPPDWAIDVRASVNFGHIETKRQEPAEPTATLVIAGTCWFGGLQITS